MNYRTLGKTGLQVSEIGFGGEWLERHPEEESVELLRYAHEKGINIVDCWMADPKSRDIIGKAMEGCREEWIVQGHVGSTWQNGQYVRTRDMSVVEPAFEDLLARLKTDYIDLGMIHFVDTVEDWENVLYSEFGDYVMQLKTTGVIRHIGMSTHNPQIAKLAAETDFIEMILFSINPVFDMMPPDDNYETYFAEQISADLSGIAPERAELYKLCEEKNVGITVMKGFEGGRLFDAKRSPLGVALTPLQCIHYSLSKPAVCSIMVGYDTKEQVDEAVSYETASDKEKEYASVLESAPYKSYKGHCTYCGHCKPCVVNLDIAMINKYYDLATAQAEVPESIQAHYDGLEQKASECIGCKACEKRCPFEVPIAERMAKAAALFEQDVIEEKETAKEEKQSVSETKKPAVKMAVPGKDGDVYPEYGKRKGKDKNKQSTVYFTRDLSPAGLMKLFDLVNVGLEGKVGVKLHTGEQHGPNIIPPDWVKEFLAAKLPDATIIETNTYYEGDRDSTEKHRETLKVNGWTFAPVDILDEEGTALFPVEGGKWFDAMSVGGHLPNYDSLLILTHFKGHTCGGFGGSNKNIGIGCADGKVGKAMIHTHEGGDQWGIGKEEFMERMTESTKSVIDHFKGHITYINVMRNMSVSCDCEGLAAEPVVTPDVGILASTDILALDQACVDLIMAMKKGERSAFEERMTSRHGFRQLTYMKELGMGNDCYRLIDIDKNHKTITPKDAVKDVKPFGTK